MRIYYISHLHPPKNKPLENMGGMQRVSAQLLDALTKMDGIHVKADLLRAPWKGISKYVAGFLTRQLVALPQKIEHYNADVVLFSSMVTASLAYPLRNKISVPMAAITHGHDVIMPFKPYQWYVPRIFKALNGVISVSEATRKECLRRGLSPQKSIVIGNGCSSIFTDTLPSKAEAEDLISNMLQIDPKKYMMLLTVGRYVKRKGHQWFLEKIFPHLNEHFIYVSIGDGPLLSQISDVVNQLNTSIAKRIHILGAQPDKVLHNFYKYADLFVMPNIPVDNDMEGFGIVILEANLAGTPVVASNLDGISDVIKNRVNGFLIDPLDEGAYIEKLNTLSAIDLTPLKQTSCKYALENYNWKKIAKRYVDYLANKII